ncbi:hypothetical protein HYU19_00375 [Candidatus Woesearchaeota archaeon]|nr:hypothetical protein [Candidatus Woesearchaeota archaeon]
MIFLNALFSFPPCLGEVGKKKGQDKVDTAVPQIVFLAENSALTTKNKERLSTEPQKQKVLYISIGYNKY